MGAKVQSLVVLASLTALARLAHAEPTPGDAALERDATSLEAEPTAITLQAPPPPPYRKTWVVDASVGALVFLGKFGKTASPGPLLRTQVGYEVLRWLMVFGGGELAFVDTSRSQDPPKTRAFALFGFGGGLRLTARPGNRLGVYLQADVGAMKADIRTNALGIIGFRDAESLNPYLGGRLGLEWYQVDRHLALGLGAGLRHATGFKGQGDTSTPLAFDIGASVRYAF